MCRHRTLTTAVAAMLLVGLAALTVAYRREKSYSERLSVANSSLDGANSRLSEANERLDARNKELDHQKKRALESARPWPSRRSTSSVTPLP